MEFLNIPLLDSEDLLKLLVKFSLNIVSAFIVIRLLYYSKNKEKDYLFTFFIFNLLTFFICFVLRKVPMELGFALGLFAVFGILRYRTETIPIKEMTYLFIVIGLAMINALSNKSISWVEILFCNVAVIGISLGIEYFWFKNEGKTKMILYDKIDLIQPSKKAELLEDLQNRTGLNIYKLEVKNVDFLRDSAEIKIYYEELLP